MICVLFFRDVQNFKSAAFIKIFFKENLFLSNLLINVDSVIQT